MVVKFITQGAVPERSGVSQRYLAQLESGQGNISIGLLLRVADALDFRIEWLVAEDELSRRLHAFIPAASIAVKSLFPRSRR
jgi:transcriptional regulator with XRE-family HTH domain